MSDAIRPTGDSNTERRENERRATDASADKTTEQRDAEKASRESATGTTGTGTTGTTGTGTTGTGTAGSGPRTPTGRHWPCGGIAAGFVDGLSFKHGRGWILCRRLSLRHGHVRSRGEIPP
jgi:hypothetical protein